LAYQFDHVAWTGCGFWDLIQPSFMFLVGAALPFSYSRRESEGQSAAARFRHVLWRSFVLVSLGVFLSSNGEPQTNFTFVNVLSQIGLGYPVLYLLRERSLRAQFAACAIILVVYWGWFANYTIPSGQLEDVTLAIKELKPKLLEGHAQPQKEWSQFTGVGSHWNKHVNAAAEVDRKLLNALPRKTRMKLTEKSLAALSRDNRVSESVLAKLAPWKDRVFETEQSFVEELRKILRENEWKTSQASIRNQARQEGVFRGQKYWFNDGGYQTLNFIPSLATMLLGLMAGTFLRSGVSDGEKVKWLLKAGAMCFGISMALDTSIWPVVIPNCDWHLAPIVKRIWSPGWAVFSSGWTFWMLGAFYWVIDVRQWRAWSWPLVIVGMNSIAMYVMSQLIKPWMGRTLGTHLVTLDAFFGWEHGFVFTLFGEFPFATPLGHAARLFGLWLVCVWLYRRKMFVRV
jgi:predicted acyltransferase